MAKTTTVPTIYVKDLVADIASLENITKSEAERRIAQYHGLIVDYLAAGYNVYLNDFFNFQCKEREAKEAINPVTKEPMIIPKVKTVHAKMTKKVKDRIQGKSK